jgi:hypothetical protein
MVPVAHQRIDNYGAGFTRAGAWLFREAHTALTADADAVTTRQTVEQAAQRPVPAATSCPGSVPQPGLHLVRPEHPTSGFYRCSSADPT